MAQPNIFSIGSQAQFLPTLVEAVLADRLNLGVDFRAEPLKLADVTIYVPTQRAAKALGVAFAGSMGGKPSFLPRILPLGGLGSEEEAFLPNDDLASSADVISDLDRRLILSKLILRWGEALREAIVSIGPDGKHVPREPNEVFVAAKNPADAWALAGQLAALMDETLIEGVDWARFQQLGQGSYDDYWRITLDFLKIAFEQWPHMLKERGLVDAVQRRSELIEREIHNLANGARRGPVIAAGSTGTNAATAKLLKAIATTKQGAVVLPGLDLDLDTSSWKLLDTAQKLASHPQAVLARLLTRLNIPRSAVTLLGEGSQDSVRAKFASEALRPAQTTDLWRQDKNWSETELATSLSQVSLIEAENEREEALAIAIALREALEAPGQTAALITPERTLAQRVAAELGRWGIVAEDSSGQSLSRTPAGALALAAIEAAREVSAVKLLALLVHPFCQLGLESVNLARQIAQFEACVLRQVDIRLYPGLNEAIHEAREKAGERHALKLAKAMSPDDWAGLEHLALQVEAALAPVKLLPAKAPLKDWASAHLASVAALAVPEFGETALSARDGTALVSLLEALTSSVDATLELDSVEYGRFFAQAAGEIAVRLYQSGHPRLAILGLLEARLMSADVVVLAGCDEKIWPPQGASDALLNRTMREELGLSSPERRLGQTAHDFVMGFCQDKIILSRAKKRGGEPTVPSRFIQRMDALASELFTDCRARGQIYLDMAQRLDAGTAPAVPRPQPRPRVELRPKALSVTKIERLRRDPYALYAERILGLPILDPLEPDLSARDFGTKTHHIFQKFVEAAPGSALPGDAEPLLASYARQEFELSWSNPIFQAFDRVKIERMLQQFLEWERERRGKIAEIHAEIRGELPFTLHDGSPFTLSAEADRIEYNRDGSLTLIDFKTGALPGPNEVKAGFAPQLTLETHMARVGAFKMLPKSENLAAFYVKFGAREGRKDQPALGRDTDLNKISADHFKNLVDLLEQFRDPATPYLARPFPKFAGKFNDYDHLSRYKEWSTQDSEAGDEA